MALASLIAGLATMPYAAFHLHGLAPYGVLANLAAMPVISIWLMPIGILHVHTMPLGFDAVFWRLMGDGIDSMIAVAVWVAQLPGAVGHIHAFGAGPFLLASADLLLLRLLRSRLRLSGLVLAFVACIWAVATPQPDVLIASDGEAAAVREQDGRLAILFERRDTFALKEWLMADGRRRCRDIKDKSLRGAITPRWNGDRFVEKDARSAGYDRPWAHGPRAAATSRRHPAAQDATPRQRDLEAGD